MATSLLVEGRIPKNKECPFSKRCELYSGGSCKHTGLVHPVPFSCAVARGFDLIQLYQAPKS